MNSEIRIEQRAELVAFPADETDDFDPDAFTALLGMAPTAVHRKGELLNSGRVRPYSAWRCETADRVEHDTELLIQEVLDKFEPVAVELANARAAWGLDIRVGLVISMYGAIQVEPDGRTGAVVSTPALYLSPQTLGRLSELGCSLDIDAYVIAPQ